MPVGHDRQVRTRLYTLLNMVFQKIRIQLLVGDAGPEHTPELEIMPLIIADLGECLLD